MISSTMFGGFPVRMLQSLGRGIGADDFLVGPEASDFVPAVFSELAENRSWHVASLHRLRSSMFMDEILRTGIRLSLSTVCVKTKDYVTEFPASYAEYLQSRTRKFRRNLNQAFNRLEKEGAVSMEILHPIADADRVRNLGMEIAKTSWQFREGKSHFNIHGSTGFYDHLAGAEQGTCGEEFSVLTVAGRPVAYLLGCRRGRSYYAVDTAYHAEYRHVSAGRILFAMILKRLMEEGNVDRFDFEGDGEYKEDFATLVWDVTLCTIYNKSLYARTLKIFRNSPLFSRLKEIGAGKPVSTMPQVTDVC
jgi:CelD/BcsL family acetyltransferase involved in cellulose biosynthesis